MSIVKINNLYKKFGDNIAVDSINITINQGEVYGLLGPNGAGKSTIINIMSGLLKMNKGSIEILHKDLGENSKFIKSNIGVVPQELAIYEELTAYENVKFFASLYGLKGSELKNKTLEALEFVGLKEKAKDYPKSFSGGMKRRLNIACAIAHTPKLIIMDEPTVGIDPQSRNHILKSVKRLNEKGSTIIYTTHYMEEVETICTRIGIIDHGKLIAEGTKEELKAIVTDKKNIKLVIDQIDNINIKELESIPGVLSVDFKENIININSNKETNNLDKIILYFTNNKISIRNITSTEPNLETVFLILTGRKLRD
jgi:ABC-2 type transport system ATP-binding protein